MDWEQANEPFSSESLEYIQQLDILKDIKLLDNTFKFRKICLRNIRITGTLLKKGASFGLSPYQICSILCRDDDYDDEPEPSLLETLVKKAQEMAKSIRKIKSTHHKEKLQSVENFKNRRKSKKTNSSSEREAIMLKQLQSKHKVVSSENPTANGEDEFMKKKIIDMKKQFADFEDSDDDKKNDEFSDTKMLKATSYVVSSSPFMSNAFDMDDPNSKMMLRRDRAQSETDSEFVFHCEKASSPRKMRQKPIKYVESSDEEKKVTQSSEDNMEDVVKSAESGSDNSDHDETDETSRSPPIKRTMSLPRIKMLEKESNLPKIKEEVEEDAEVSIVKINSDSNESPQNDLSSSVPIKSSSPFKKIKMTRQISSDIVENNLKDSPYDEDFFYYFDMYLEEAIKKIANKNQKLVAGRNRSMSEF